MSSLIEKNPKISIIVRTYNEEKWIGSCLKAIYEQTYKNIEVVLVDNNSKDQTVEKAQQFPVKLVTIDKFMPGKAINIGIEASTGEYICIISAHCIPVNNSWLENLLLNFEDTNVAGVYGRQEPMSFTPDTDKRDLLIVFGLDKKVQHKDSFFHNANSMIRRDLWKETPFDDNATNIEDRIWAREIIKQGKYHLVYEPEASVYHYHGIHQNQNQERCKNVVRIIEELEQKDNQKFSSLNLDNMNVWAIIPCKGKPIKIGNKSLLEIAVKDAQKSKYINKIIVSTDNQETIEEAKALGVDTPLLRDESLSQDYVDLEKVYEYTLSKLEEEKQFADLIVPIEITYPFRPSNILDEMIERIANEGLDSVIPAKKEYSAIWKYNKNDPERVDDGFIPRKFKDPVYIGMKGLGVVTHPMYIRESTLLGKNVGILEIDDPLAAIEIRDEASLKFAESFASRFL